jgi:FMN-dependent NADH-azoreductase
MPTLLAIEVSPRHEFSTSRKLTALFIDRWTPRALAPPSSSAI